MRNQKCKMPNIIMLDLERELHRLPKVNPTPKFCEEAKGRILHQILDEANERWFIRVLKNLRSIYPSAEFLAQARVRLLARIQSIKQPLWGWWLFTKRAMASALVLTLAVTTTLFFIDRQTPVSASENSYLEVTSGEVSLKHADQLIWDPVTTPVELSAGDLIRLGEGASATIRFFDDSELRLAENSTLLLSRLSVSPAFARQGVIEVSLNQGKAWIQTLNVDDGYADFSLFTPNTHLSARNATFDVQAGLFEPTRVRVFRHSIFVSALKPDSRQTIASGKLNINQEVNLDGSQGINIPSNSLAGYAPISDIPVAEALNDWVLNNLKADQAHLSVLRQRELEGLKVSAGTLPGEFLYPLKRAKERLELAFSLNQEAETNLMSYIANQRLSEAIVLLEQNDSLQAQIALDEYQKLVQKLTDEGQDPSLVALVAAHQKALIAALPGDSKIGIVSKVLSQTKELMADNPVKRAQVRIQNSVEELAHAYDFTLSDDLATAESILKTHTSIASLEVIQGLSDEQNKALYQSLLEAQYEEKQLLAEISREIVLHSSTNELMAFIQDQSKNLEVGIRQTVSTIRSIMPEVVLSQAAAFSMGQKAREFAQKILIYKTWQGQKNQVKRLVSNYPQYAYDLDFWAKVRDNLDGTAKVVIESRIASIEYENAQLKAKQVKQKIIRAQRLYEKRVENKLKDQVEAP